MLYFYIVSQTITHFRYSFGVFGHSYLYIANQYPTPMFEWLPFNRVFKITCMVMTLPHCCLSYLGKAKELFLIAMTYFLKVGMVG